MKTIKLLTVLACTLAIMGVSSYAETCCEKAKKAGKECEHQCCKDAAKAKKTCEKCNPKKEETKK